ncbi:MAG: hypothetical protein IJN62_05985 [Clostridia bacterium]|nr:hypothetical protein [Clostridia bacterium]
MYKRYYDGYNSYQRSNTSYSGEVVIPKESVEETSLAETIAETASAPEDNIEFTVHDSGTAVAAIPKTSVSSIGGLSKLFNDIDIDDIILFGVILLVLKDSADDPLLIIILTVVFLAGLLDD